MSILLEEEHLKPRPSQPPRSKKSRPKPEVPDAAQPWDGLTLGLLAGALGLLLALSWPLPRHLWIEYTEFESYYAYGPAIPFLAGFLLWHRRAALRAAPRVPCPAAFAVLLPAMGLLVWSSAQEMALVMSFSFLLSFWSAVWLVLGTRWVRAAAFPLAPFVIGVRAMAAQVPGAWWLARDARRRRGAGPGRAGAVHDGAARSRRLLEDA